MRISISSPIATRKRQQGVATVVMLILIALLLGIIIANMNTLSDLHRDVKRIEQRQLHRLNSVTVATSTNSPSAQAAK